MQKKFLQTLAILLVLNLIIKPLWVLGIRREVLDTVGREEFGIYFPLFSLTFILNIILDFGITNYNNRNIAREHDQLSKAFSDFFSLRILLGIIYCIVCLLVGFAMQLTKQEFHLLYFLIFNQFLLQFILYMRSNISGLQLFKLDSLLSILDRTFLIIICGALLYTNIINKPFQIEWFVYCQSAAYSLTFIIIFVIVLSKSRFFKPRIDFKNYFKILREVFPYALLVLLMASYSRIDSVMLSRMLEDGRAQAGTYAQSFFIFELLTNYGLLFAALLLPMFARMIKQKEEVGGLVKTGYLLLVIPSLAFVLAAIYYKTEIINLLYEDVPDDSPIVFGFMMLAFVFYATNYIFGALLTANGSLKSLNIMAASGLLLNVLLNVILIPRFEVIGAAIACLSTQVFTAIFQIIAAKVIIRLKMNYKLMLFFALYCILVIAIGFFKDYFPFNWKIQFVLFVTVNLIIAGSFRLINIKEMLQILKTKES